MNELDTLALAPDTICNLILRAREFHAKEELTIPEKSPNSEYEYDWAQILADHSDDLTFTELHGILLTLEPDQKVDLLALFYLGRDDYDTLNEAREAVDSNAPVDLAGYLLHQPLLASYLEKALSTLGYSCEE